MSASPRPQDRNPDDQAHMFVAEYQLEYTTALDRAREAAKTTQTPAWMANFESQTKTHQEAVAECLKSIRDTCEIIKSADTDEECEKAVRDSVKAMAEERVRFSAWRNRAVNVYRQAAIDCQSIKGKAVRNAQDDERQSPLVNSGLSGRVSKIVAEWPGVEWDEERGIVLVDDE